MTVNSNQAISMAEVLNYVEKDSDASAFIKKFVKLKPKEAEEMKEKLQNLGLMKLKEEHTVKIVDLLPENQEDLNKIFVGVSLDEDETNKILDIVKQYK